ncbi:MAG: glycosyltransferase family 39 protein [Candidatus Thermoplasmatota archaeon]|nr:glycosyltransferase family 39 protein [Candidatus Thermoplasmatota archaeon]
MNSRDKHLLVVICLALAFIFFRLHNIQNPFSTNGIDEGIHLLQARMVSAGYNLYTDLNGDQGPLAILTFALWQGEVLTSRLLSFLLFGAATAASTYLAWRVKNRQAGAYTLLILALDFTLLRESRVASLDLFSGALLALAAVLLVWYLERGDWRLLLPGGALVSLACLAKMLAAPVALALLLWLIYRGVKNGELPATVAYVTGALLPLAVVLALFSPQSLLEGLVLRQTHRAYDWGAKASALLFIGPGFVYLAAVRRWNYRDAKVMLLLLWLLPLLALILLQGRTFQHHFAYTAFPAAILAGMALSTWSHGRRRAVLASFVAVNAALGPALILTAPTDPAYEAAAEIEEVTPPGSLVISGNPLVNVLADRLAPPNLTNLAYYHYPPATASNVTYWLEKGEVAAVVLYWKLADMDRVEEYLNASQNYTLHVQIEERGQILMEGLRPGFSTDRYTVYLRRSPEPGP